MPVAGLIQRNSLDFADIADWRRFVDELVARRNRRREDALHIELAALKPLPARRTTDFTEVVARVTKPGDFLVHQVLYSAPSQLISQRLRIHVYDYRIEAFHGATHFVTHPRRRSREDDVRVHRVNYHHFIHALRRKSHALAPERLREVTGIVPMLAAKITAGWPEIDVDKALPWIEQKTSLSLAASQAEAIRLALRSKLMVITGGPGVGKKLVVLFDQKKAVAIAVKDLSGRRRWSQLGEWLGGNQ